MCVVIRRCGADGTGGPSCRSTRPLVKRGADSSSPETNWLEPEASITASPPSTRPVPRTVSGRPPVGDASIDTPSERSASTIGRSGRLRACGSPSKSTVPSASAAAGGRNRMMVPARPTSTRAGPRSGPGVDHPALVGARVHADAERAQPGGHQRGVAGAQRPLDHRRVVGERGEHQRARGHRLGAGQAHGRGDGPDAVGASQGRRSAVTAAILPPGYDDSGGAFPRAGTVSPGRTVAVHVRPVRDHAERSRPQRPVRRRERRRGPAAELERRADRPGAGGPRSRSAATPASWTPRAGAWSRRGPPTCGPAPA